SSFSQPFSQVCQNYHDRYATVWRFDKQYSFVVLAEYYVRDSILWSPETAHFIKYCQFLGSKIPSFAVTCHLMTSAQRPGHEPRRVFCAVGSMPLLAGPVIGHLLDADFTALRRFPTNCNRFRNCPDQTPPEKRRKNTKIELAMKHRIALIEYRASR